MGEYHVFDYFDTCTYLFVYQVTVASAHIPKLIDSIVYEFIILLSMRLA